MKLNTKTTKAELTDYLKSFVTVEGNESRDELMEAALNVKQYLDSIN